MQRLIAYVKNGIVTIQQAEYQEDGWYIKISGEEITLFEIPYGGGEDVPIGTYNAIIDAINAGNALT